MLHAVVLASFVATMVGGFAPRFGKLLTRERLSRALALRSGLLLAVAFSDVLPEAWAAGPRAAGASAFAAFAMCYAADYFAVGDSCHEAVEECHSHAVGFAALVGILAHSFVDGVNVAAAKLIGPEALAAAGASVVFCHLADGFTLTTLFGKSGFDRRAVLAILAAVGLSTALGAAFAGPASRLEPGALAVLLGFSGGCFVYVGAADVLPRLHRDRDPAALGFFGAGAAAMAGLRFLLG